MKFKMAVSIWRPEMKMPLKEFGAKVVRLSGCATTFATYSKKKFYIF